MKWDTNTIFFFLEFVSQKPAKASKLQIYLQKVLQELVGYKPQLDLSFSSALVQTKKLRFTACLHRNEVHDHSLKCSRGIHLYKTLWKVRHYIIIIGFVVDIIIVEIVQCFKPWITVDSGKAYLPLYFSLLFNCDTRGRMNAMKDMYQTDEEKWLLSLWSNMLEQILTTAEKVPLATNSRDVVTSSSQCLSQLRSLLVLPLHTLKFIRRTWLMCVGRAWRCIIEVRWGYSAFLSQPQLGNDTNTSSVAERILALLAEICS